MRTCPKCSAERPAPFLRLMAVWRCRGCGVHLVPNERRLKQWGFLLITPLVATAIWDELNNRVLGGIGDWLALIIVAGLFILPRLLPLTILSIRKKRELTAWGTVLPLITIVFGIVLPLPDIFDHQRTELETIIFSGVLIAFAPAWLRETRALDRELDLSKTK